MHHATPRQLRGWSRRFFAASSMALSLSCAAQTEAVAPSRHDVFDETPQSALERTLTAAEFGDRRAEVRLRRLLEEKPLDAPADPDALRAWNFLCSQSFHRGVYRAAVADCARSLALPGGDEVQTFELARALADQPAPHLQGTGARLPIDADGKVPTSINGVEAAAVPDTGAQISVIMASVAERAHVRRLGTASVGSTTGDVSGSIGVVPRLGLGSAILYDLPVLILPDASLTFDEGRLRMPFILSLYALGEFGRVAWLDHGRLLALGSSAPRLGLDSVPAFWHPLGLGLPMDGPRGRRAAHFDSGANESYFYPAALEVLAPDESARAQESVRRIGGAGGVATQKVRKLPQATVTVAGHPIVFREIDVAEQPETGEAARLGSDMLSRFSTVVLDIAKMRFSAVD